MTLYSISSRCTKVEAAFEEKYPDIDCVPFDISTNELLEKVTREYDAGQHVADVVHIKDQDGSMWNMYVANKTFYNYQPADIFAHIDPSYTATATPLYIELTQLFYKMSEKLYQQQAPQGDPNMGGQQPGGDPNGGQQYYDADYKVVDDDDQNK
mgnify:FL=1